MHCKILWYPWLDLWGGFMFIEPSFYCFSLRMPAQVSCLVFRLINRVNFIYGLIVTFMIFIKIEILF